MTKRVIFNRRRRNKKRNLRGASYKENELVHHLLPHVTIDQMARYVPVNIRTAHDGVSQVSKSEQQHLASRHPCWQK